MLDERIQKLFIEVHGKLDEAYSYEQHIPKERVHELLDTIKLKILRALYEKEQKPILQSETLKHYNELQKQRMRESREKAQISEMK